MYIIAFINSLLYCYRPEQRQFMEDNVKTQLANIHKDPKGLYTVSILREGNIFDNSVASVSILLSVSNWV